MIRRFVAVAVALGAGWVGSARAQDRPSEEQMFGGPAPAAPAPGAPAPGAPAQPAPRAPVQKVPPPVGAPPAAATEGVERDQAVLGDPGSEMQHLSDYQAPENPLQIGGQLYLRAQSTGRQGQGPDNWRLTAPSLVDVYFDARPNPRVRGFILERMSYDPTAPISVAPVSAAGLEGGSGGAFVGSSTTGFTTFNASRGPNTLLDQLWIRFDILERVFVTAGKQHVRWGTGRFWQPTDYLHNLKRNPLDVFDARAGVSMLKLHVPWEDRGWNFYGFLVSEDPTSDTNQLRKVAAAARAEIVIAGAEIGVDTFLRQGQRPRFGIDASTGIWDFDVYIDAAIRSGEDFPVVRKVDSPTQGVPCVPMPPAVPVGATVNDLASQYVVQPLSGVTAQVVGGLTWSRKYNDNDLFTLGAEYFYNQPGYPDATLYPGLLFNQSGAPLLNFFYIGRHYGALFASFPAPYSWNYTTFTFSTLGNISDRSFVSRVDYSHTVLTHLSLEAFVGVHYGYTSGEFRLGFDIPDQFAANGPTMANGTVPCIPIIIPNRDELRQPILLDLGIALRLRI